MAGPEQIFSVTPTIDTLVGLGYNFLSQDQNELARDGLNQVLLRDEFIASVQRLNDVPEEVARAAYSELLGVRDNERWTRLLRGDYSRTIPGQPEKKTIKLIDFLHSGNNTFTVTEELTVEAQKTRRADLVVYANGIPLVVIECKSPLSPKDKTGEAFDQIKAIRAGHPAPVLLQRLLHRHQRPLAALRRDRRRPAVLGLVERPLAEDPQRLRE